MKKILSLFVFCLFVCAASVSAQPRPMDKKPEPNSTPRTSVPAFYNAKYEGGMFGFGDSEKGTLRFDDTNERLVFFWQRPKGNVFDSL